MTKDEVGSAWSLKPSEFIGKHASIKFAKQLGSVWRFTSLCVWRRVIVCCSVAAVRNSCLL